MPDHVQALAATRRQAIGALGGAALLVASAKAEAAANSGPWQKHEFVDVAGGRIHCAISGAGAEMPLVVFPKLGGWANDWAAVAALLAPRRKVIAIDFPGHGESRMNGPAPYATSIPEVAAMALSALDQLGVSRFAVGGVSMGGVVSAYLAAKFPEKVTSLILVSTQLRPPASWEALREQDERRKVTGEGEPRSHADLQKMFGTLDPRISEDQAAANERAGAWKRSCERGVARLGIEQYLTSIAAPALLISADRGTYLRYTEVARKHIANLKVAMIAETGSFVQQEQPVKVAAAIEDFLS